MTDQGILFTHNHVPRGEPTGDSRRMRKRIAVLFSILKLDGYVTGTAIEAALGVDVPYGYSSTLWEQLFMEMDLKDFLNVITVISNILVQRAAHLRPKWLAGVATVFSEENVRYRVDAIGSVHFAVDGEYAHNQLSALAALQAPRYAAARTHFEAGQQALDATPPQTREAIRQTFEAAETVFKLMFPSVAILGASEITKKLRPHLEATLNGTERDSASLLVEAFKSWANSAQPYRHGQAVEVPDNPSLATAILSVSLGASFVRWLAELDTVVTASDRSDPSIGGAT